MLSVGEILKKERLNKGLTLAIIEKQLKVREKFIKAIEDNNWEFFSSKIYITGILKNYSRILGLEPKRVLAFFRRDYEKKEDIRFKKKVSSSDLTSGSKRVFRLIIFATILIFVIYFGYQLRLYFQPPKLVILSPKTTSFTTENKIKVTGQTEKDAIVTIVNQRVYLASDGTFSYELPLKEGENRIIIELTGANGKKAKVEKTFIKRSPK
jgi:cytoskeletal protein RodZ